MFFLVKVAGVGYAAFWLVNLGFERLAQRGMPREDVRVWSASVLYICLAAILESPLFIATTLLYRDSKQQPEGGCFQEPCSGGSGLALPGPGCATVVPEGEY